MDLGLIDKVALVTGPAKGMGAAITRALAAEGCRLVLAGRDLAAIAPVKAEVEALGRPALVVACDVTDPAACDAAVAGAVERFGTVDVLVNVAGGTGPIGRTGAETSAAEFRDIVDVNMTGPFAMIRAVAPVMMAARSGKIVNVGGTFGLRGRAGRMAYSASKWGLRGLTKSFALELGPTASTSTAWRRAWWMARASARRSAATWRPGSGSPRRRPPAATPRTTR